MDNKLKELTRKLYDQGLERGRAEAEDVVSEARREAEAILSAARGEAEAVLSRARAEAEELKHNTMTKLNLSGNQVVSKLKAAIRDMVTARALGDGVTLEPALLREVIVAAAGAWQGEGDVMVSLPAGLRERLDAGFAESVGPVEVRFSERVGSGFRLAPKDGGYYIDFSEEAFRELLGRYLRPKVDEILYR